LLRTATDVLFSFSFISGRLNNLHTKILWNKLAITKGQCSVDFREHADVFVLECARCFKHDPNTQSCDVANCVDRFLSYANLL
jgi:hypothetical protein